MADGSRWSIRDGLASKTLKQKQVIEQHTINIDEQTTEEKLKALCELLDENLKVDDDLAEKGWDSYVRMRGLVEDRTIFKFEVEADGDKELTKKESTVQYEKKLPNVKAMAIGPYHRQNQNLLRFNDDYKWKITRFMVKYYSLDAKKYFKEIEKKELSARNRYNTDFLAWNSKNFLTMLLLDSCFVLFTMDAFSQRLLWLPKYFNEYMALYADIKDHSKRIKLDLLMVDNQIPFFTIELLFDCFPKANVIFKEKKIKDLALSCFDDLWPTGNKEQKMSDETDFDHVLQLFHRSRIPVEGYEMDYRTWEKKKSASQQYIPSATELQKSATKLKKKHSGSNLDITFARGLMMTYICCDQYSHFAPLRLQRRNLPQSHRVRDESHEQHSLLHRLLGMHVLRSAERGGCEAAQGERINS